jgi:hypothetical protein
MSESITTHDPENLGMVDCWRDVCGGRERRRRRFAHHCVKIEK